MKIKKLKVKNIDFSKVEKILVIKLRAIGDVLLSTPVIHNLRDAFPDAQLDFLVEPLSVNILLGNPYINNIILFLRGERSYFSFLRSLKEKKYDLVIDLFCNPRSAQMTYFTRAKYRVGYAFRLRKYAYNILLQSRSEEVHNIDFNIDALRALDINVKYKSTELYLSCGDNDFADNFYRRTFKANYIVFGINAGGSCQSRLWGLTKYAGLADKIIESFNYKVLVFWGPGQEQICETLKSLMKYDPIIAPPTTLKEMAALQRKCKFVISNDSGPMHIAASMGIPTLGIMGPTRPFAQGPIGNNCTFIVKEGLDCLGCNLTSCKDNKCMTDLSVDEVYKKVLEWQNIHEE
jgi:ADP-heptose:LPS heptosyltransferase